MKDKKRYSVYLFSQNQLFGNGAVNKIVDNIYEFLISNNFTSRIICEYENQRFDKNKFLTYKVRKGRLRKITVFIILFIKLLLVSKPNIIHHHQMGIELYPILLISILRKINIVITNHFEEYEGIINGQKISIILNQKQIKLIKYINNNSFIKIKINFICISKEIYQQMIQKGISKDNLYLINNGI